MEKSMKLALSLLAVGLFFATVTHGQKTFNEQCDEEKTVTTNTSSGVTVTHFKDNCDKKVYLTCKDSRCRCADAVFGVYTSKEVKIASRSKRSPGKGSKGSKGKVSTGKAVAVGAGAAVVAGGAGYIIGQNSANSGNHGSGSWSSGSSGSSRSRDKYTTVHSCFQRVGGDCAIDTNKVTEVTNTTIMNGTTTTTKTTIDYKERPECIQGAECVAKRIPGEDTNIGECTCISGYGKTKTDLCVKLQKSSAGVSATSLGLILGALFINLV